LDYDKKYVIKKLEIDEEEYNQIMRTEIKSFKDYPNNYFFHRYLRGILSLLRTLKVFHN